MLGQNILQYKLNIIALSEKKGISSCVGCIDNNFFIQDSVVKSRKTQGCQPRKIYHIFSNILRKKKRVYIYFLNQC